MKDKDADINKVERLVHLFKPERYAYLAISSLACIAIIILAIKVVIDDSSENGHFVWGAFASGGVVGVAMMRMMKMWNDVIKILFKTDLAKDV
ncbi:MAG: hypothetical protein HKN48_04600 [Flavobacteriaceae bacterium]|nr:hypothetical protein [Flavobacteriaceae bacterium]